MAQGKTAPKTRKAQWNEKIRRRNEARQIDGHRHNVWRLTKGLAFTAIPAWWRRFIFHVLTPAEIATYIGVCFYTGEHAVAYPGLSRLQNDLDYTTPKRIKTHLENLVKLGFLITEREKVKGEGVVYQRPSIYFTLRTLILLSDEKKKGIDYRLLPRGADAGDDDLPSREYRKLLRKDCVDDDGNRFDARKKWGEALSEYETNPDKLDALFEQLMRLHLKTLDVDRSARLRPHSEDAVPTLAKLP